MIHDLNFSAFLGKSLAIAFRKYPFNLENNFLWFCLHKNARTLTHIHTAYLFNQFKHFKAI